MSSADKAAHCSRSTALGHINNNVESASSWKRSTTAAVHYTVGRESAPAY
jgi:hypothetical protein